MTDPDVQHATLVLERLYDASPTQVFAAWEDPRARERWGAPNDSVEVIFLETDFRIGGRDLSRCGPKGNAVFAVETRYENIVPGRRIVFAETVAHEEARLSASLITVTIDPADDGRAALTLTCQIAALDGSDMAAGARAGWTGALANLAADLRRTAVA